MYQRNRLSMNVLLAAALFSLAFIATGYGSDNVTIAFVNKIIKDVTKRSGQGDWSGATKGEILLSGDQVRTGQKSLALIKFLDNSIVHVRELSLLTLSSDAANGNQTKSVQLSAGAVGFSVQKQQNQLFRLTSPTSVASIRGTKGKWAGGKGQDTLVITEGLVNLRNTVADSSIDVPSGFIGFSNQDGTLSSRRATAQELADANNAASGGSSNELNLELKDSKGNKKELKIRFKQ